MRRYASVPLVLLWAVVARIAPVEPGGWTEVERGAARLDRSRPLFPLAPHTSPAPVGSPDATSPVRYCRSTVLRRATLVSRTCPAAGAPRDWIAPALCFPSLCPTVRRFLILATALFAALPAAAQDTQTYRSAEGGFALDLPAAWVRAPASAVEEARRASARPSLTYEAVFEAASARPASAMFVAVIARRVVPRGLTLEEFRGLATASGAQPRLQGLATGADTARGVRVGLREGETWWDEANRASWVRADDEATGGFAWTVLMLHPSGGSLIMLQYSANAGQDEEQVLAQLDEVVRSLRVD